MRPKLCSKCKNYNFKLRKCVKRIDLKNKEVIKKIRKRGCRKYEECETCSRCGILIGPNHNHTSPNSINGKTVCGKCYIDIAKGGGKQMITPEEAVNLVLGKAPEMLKQDGSHGTILFIFGEKDAAIASIKVNTKEQMHIAMKLAGWKSIPMVPNCVAIISEAWVTRLIPPEGKQVHDMPDKQETLVIAAQDIDGKTHGAMVLFSHIGGEIFLGETIYSKVTESVLLTEFWEGTRQ